MCCTSGSRTEAGAETTHFPGAAQRSPGKLASSLFVAA